MQQKKCAYCGVHAALTKEHLLPECISKHWEKDVETNVRAGTSDRIITGDPQIRDVCADCNNGPLSELDQYACTLYEEHFARLVRPGDQVKLNLEFDMLLRWLLKTGYNAARARKWSTSFEQLTGYILGRDAHRPPSRVFLQLIIPTKVNRGDIKDFPDATEVPPSHHRLSRIDSTLLPGLKIGFLLTLNSYYFYVLLEDPSASKKTRLKSCNAIVKKAPGACELKPNKRFTAYSSSVDMRQAEMQSEARIRNVLSWGVWKARKK